MAIGTGATMIQTIPVGPYMMDSALFRRQTIKQVKALPSKPHPGAGESWNLSLPQVGLCSKLRIVFEGQVVVAGGAIVTGPDWPYNLLKGFELSGNGSNDLFKCDGIDLTVLRDLSNPAFVEAVHDFPGTIGGGDTVANGTYPLYLSWVVPVAFDPITLIGSLFLQSSSANVQVTGKAALNTELVTTDPSHATITGTWTVEETYFEVPFGPNGELIVPDVTRLHGFNQVNVPFGATGDTKIPLIRSQGQLHRILTRVYSDDGVERLSADPTAADAVKIDTFHLEYGLNKFPLVFDPAATLREQNNEWYGGPGLYDSLILDFAREDPIRDAIIMQGITELNVVAGVNSAVTVVNGRARACQESLF